MEALVEDRFDRVHMATDAIDLLLAATQGSPLMAWPAGLPSKGGFPRLFARGRMPVPGGRSISFHLAVEAGDRILHVRELEPRRIPKCPGRHMYRDESFCFGDPALPTPQTPWQAELCWGFIWGYLELQVEAELLGKWNTKHEFPHVGALGILEHKLAELLASTLPEAAARAVGQAVEPRSPCPCGSGRDARNCHLERIQKIAKFQDSVAEHERAFWAEHAGERCCRTLLECPMRASTPVIYKTDYLEPLFYRERNRQGNERPGRSDIEGVL